MKKPNRESVREHAIRAKEQGLTRVTLWVPKDLAQEIYAEAARLRAAKRMFAERGETR